MAGAYHLEPHKVTATFSRKNLSALGRSTETRETQRKTKIKNRISQIINPLCASVVPKIFGLAAFFYWQLATGDSPL